MGTWRGAIKEWQGLEITSFQEKFVCTSALYVSGEREGGMGEAFFLKNLKPKA